MTKARKSRPGSVIPYLVVPHVDQLIQFLQKVFDAEELVRHARADGSIQHAEVRLGDSRLMMGEPGGSGAAKPAMLYLDVPDADTAYEAALAAGATTVRKPADQPHGVRLGGVADLWGNEWWVAGPLKGDR